MLLNLCSFSKNDGEIAVFSRVDRSRDLLSYVRSLDDTEFPRSKSNYGKPKTGPLGVTQPKNTAASVNWVIGGKFLILWISVISFNVRIN